MGERGGRAGLRVALTAFAAGTVVVVPFPFTDKSRRRRRPAVVVSTEAHLSATGHLICAMITSATRSAWPGDVVIADRAAAGLEVDCVVRLKLFSLDARLVIRAAGALSAADWQAVRKGLSLALA